MSASFLPERVVTAIVIGAMVGGRRGFQPTLSVLRWRFFGWGCRASRSSLREKLSEKA